MSRDWKDIRRRLRELGERAKAEGRLIDVEEFVEIIGLDEDSMVVANELDDPIEAGDAEKQQVGSQALTVSSGQLRAVMKELHDRDISEIALTDLLDRLRVGPLQRPASEYVDLPVTLEGLFDPILSILRRGRRTPIDPTPWFTNWISYSPLLDHGSVRRAWAMTFCRLSVHLFDQYFSLERGARLYCDACGREVALRGEGDK
jgi:hypothetical protein